MEKPRINLGRAAPELYQVVGKLDSLVSAYAQSAGIADGFSHLLRLRASQLNQCAFCVRLHTRDALASGESSDRISVLTAWRESQYFTQEERAALALIEAVILVANGQVPKRFIKMLRRCFQRNRSLLLNGLALPLMRGIG